MPVGPLGGTVLPGLHDEGLRGKDTLALVDDNDLSMTASCVCVSSGTAGAQSRIAEGVNALTISGVTRDSAGNALGGCAVHMFDSVFDQRIGVTTSDGSGNFSFQLAYPEYTYYLVAYLAGTPDVSGTTLNTLAGS